MYYFKIAVFLAVVAIANGSPMPSQDEELMEELMDRAAPGSDECKLPYQEANKACKAACRAQKAAGTMQKGCKKQCNATKKADVAANCS